MWCASVALVLPAERSSLLASRSLNQSQKSALLIRDWIRLRISAIFCMVLLNASFQRLVWEFCDNSEVEFLCPQENKCGDLSLSPSLIKDRSRDSPSLQSSNFRTVTRVGDLPERKLELCISLNRHFYAVMMVSL